MFQWSPCSSVLLSKDISFPSAIFEKDARKPHETSLAQVQSQFRLARDREEEARHGLLPAANELLKSDWIASLPVPLRFHTFAPCQGACVPSTYKRP